MKRTLAAIVLAALGALFAVLPATTAAAAPGARMTSFNPRVHGFQFANDFETTPFQDIGLNDVRFGGLCGGMSYLALDHFYTGRAAPRQDALPATGTALYNAIYQRQVTSLQQNADKWLELIVNPFGWRTGEFFNWGLQGFNGGRLQELRQEIDAGRPVPLGLFVPGSGGLRSHHQVVAVGYDTGRYAGDLGAYKEDLKIYVYDPNYPNEIVTMVPRPATQTYQYLKYPENVWQTYFVDRGYRTVIPPVFVEPGSPGGDQFNQLLLHVRTGGDDLRGGNDNVNATVHFRSRGPVVIPNINRGARWIDHYDQRVYLNMPAVMRTGDVTGVTLTTTLNGDNWNVDRIEVLVPTTGQVLHDVTGAPVVRFTSENRPYLARIDQVLDGGFEEQSHRGVSAPWGVEGPDAKGVDIALGYQHTGAKNGFIWSNSRSWNALVQPIPVALQRNYVLRGWIRTSGTVTAGYFGIRSGGRPYAERPFSAAQHAQYRQIEIPFNSGPNSVMTVFAGYWAPGTDSWVQVDGISVLPA